jgi:hypothetical protein
MTEIAARASLVIQLTDRLVRPAKMLPGVIINVVTPLLIQEIDA